jgi:D-amino peptidase
MVAGVEECDVALFLGYHAKMGTAKSTFDHTYSGGTIHKLEINDIPVSEYLLNAYTAGVHNVPVILVAGDAQLMEDDVKKFTPWTECVVLKESYSRISAKSPAMGVISKNLKIATQKAISNYKEKKVKILDVGKDITVRITFRASLMADVADLLPTVKRIDGLTVEYKAKNMVEGYNIFQVLVAAAGSTNSLMNYLK